MEALAILLLIVLIILVVSFRNRMSDQIHRLETEIMQLRKRLEKAADKAIPEISKPAEASPVQNEPPGSALEEPAGPQHWESGFKITEEPVPSSTAQETSRLNEMIPSEETTMPVQEQNSGEGMPVLKQASVQASARQAKERRPGFFERHPDLEKFIGEDLISKIGIAVLVLAIAYFVKYAIDNDWIGPAGRVGIGLLCGAILAVIAHFMRNSYKAFSSVLAGGSLAIFYFTVTLAYHQYGLFNQTASFIIMVIITCFAVALSILYNRQELAIIALVGGFATPFLTSNGNGDYKTLFIYLLILNSGLLAIAYNKAWRLLNLLAFIFTVLLFGSWLIMLDDAAIAYRNAFIFATLFYLIFFTVNIAHNIKEHRKFIASDFGILLANTCLYFAAGLFCLTEIYAEEFRGLFCVTLGVFNLGASYFLFRNRKVDNNILYLLIGITLTFISLTAPIQLNGNNITLFWASEAVLLYWLFQKSRIRLLQTAAVIVWACMLISLLMDWSVIYSRIYQPLPVIVNRGFITTMFAAVSCFLLFILRKEDGNEGQVEDIKNGSIRIIPRPYIFLTIAIIVLFAAGYLEINHQFHQHYPGTDLHFLYTTCYTLAFVLLFTILVNKVALLAVNIKTVTWLLIFCILLYLIRIPESFYIQRYMLEQQVLKSHFTAHWLTAILTGLILFRLITIARLHHGFLNVKTNILAWIFCIITVIYLSTEIHLIINALFYSSAYSLPQIQHSFIKTGWPILWGLCSFGFMWLGMHYKFKTLRIISLTLFSLTLLKLFFYDIRNVSAGGKIAAFFSLGVLLLVVSFMYQRLKKIIVDEEEPV